MDLIAQYAQDDDDYTVTQDDTTTNNNNKTTDNANNGDNKPSILKKSINIAPDVVGGTKGLAGFGDTSGGEYIPSNARMVGYNPRADVLYAPVFGPENPYYSSKQTGTHLYNNTLTGYYESGYNISNFMFDSQFNTFQSLGFAQNPDPVAREGQKNVIVSSAVPNAPKDATPDMTVYHTETTVGSNGTKRNSRKRLKSGDPTDLDYMGPWAKFEGVRDIAINLNIPDDILEKEREKKRKLDKEKGIETEDKTKGGKEEDEEGANMPAENIKIQPGEEGEVTTSEGKIKGGKVAIGFKDRSILHIKQIADYQGRTFISPPSHLKAGAVPQAFLPKKWVHTWTGHTKGISAIRFFPDYGHLLLSSSMDGKVKIWDVYNSGQCIRTYLGHSKAVRDVCFNNAGDRFTSASYDRNIKFWDTETGQVIGTYSNGKIPYVVKINPDKDKQHEMLVGSSDKKIIQWDTRSGQIVQEYDQHLGAVNTITFIDENRRFVSSSDDKTLRIWEYGIPVVIKYIAEPHMHSMPSIAMHPNQKWFAAQSLDNQILIYSAHERFRLHKKKRFVGHINAGYACQVNFSADGRFVISGDSEGSLWIWDWKTSKKLKTIKAHDGVCIACAWHPLEPSKVVTAGWDGNIKYWD